MPQLSGGEAEQELYREIQRAIAERRLVPGVKLTEDSLASLFNVSRERVRKVLLILAKEHIVTKEPNRGAFVRRPTVAEARHILAARRLVEDHMAKEAAKFATRRQIAELRAILVDEGKARAASDFAAMMRLSGNFHLKLCECGQNPALTEFVNGLISRSYLILAVYQRRNAQTCLQDDHRKIVDLVEKGEGEEAARAMAHHFDHVEAELDLAEESPAPKSDLKDMLNPPN